MWAVMSSNKLHSIFYQKSYFKSNIETPPHFPCKQKWKTYFYKTSQTYWSLMKNSKNSKESRIINEFWLNQDETNTTINWTHAKKSQN